MTYIHNAKKLKTKWCALKLDISKAYDRLSWNFIEAVLTCMLFPSLWIQLIKKCYSTVSYSVLFNGHFAGSFLPHKGLRQRNPLSSNLFLLCSNVLSCFLHDLEVRNKIKGIQFACRGPHVTHLMYADDTILFFEATPPACAAIKEVLDLYGQLAGQAINKKKSSMIFSPNTSRTFKKYLSSNFGVPYKPNLGKYLGVYVDQPSQQRNYTELLNKLQQRLSGWKAKLLSQAGRLVLAKSVLKSIPLYKMGSFFFPNKVLTKMNSLVSDFFWGYKNDRPAMHLLK